MKTVKNTCSNLISKAARTRLVAFLKDWAENEGTEKENQYTNENYLIQTFRTLFTHIDKRQLFSAVTWDMWHDFTTTETNQFFKIFQDLIKSPYNPISPKCKLNVQFW